ncbi:MAG TPA: sigma-70 family RNA polymerase sigma factor [Streptosporangiaceae bacterium]|nr:sigma-70 family RNA polymerase sigma factor [Streptosporangiaceae bacterium]
MMAAESGPEHKAGDTETMETPVSALLRSAADGDRQAWDRLVDRYADLVWSICRKLGMNSEDAADAVQLTWLALLENLDRIREPERLAGWLATTCRRQCLSIMRRSRPTVHVEDDLMERLLSHGSAADEPLLTAEQFALVWQAFRQLSELCQRVLRALVVEPEDGPPSYRAVAVNLQMPVGSLGPTRARCLNQLRKLLDSSGI